MNSKIQQYIDKSPKPQKSIIKKLYLIIIKEFPNITEEIKYGVPYFGNMFYNVSLKDHVNLGFSITNLKADAIKLLQGKGKITRHLPFYELKDLNEETIEKIIDVLHLVKN